MRLEISGVSKTVFWDGPYVAAALAVGEIDGNELSVALLFTPDLPALG
jgi:hypothetical protein